MSLLDNRGLLKGIFSNLAKECVILVTGQSGAGKGTLIDGFKKLNFYDAQVKCIVSTGDEFRKKINTASSDVRDILQSINDRGERQNGFIAAMLVSMEVMNYWDKRGITIIEGSPRSPEEVEYLLKFFFGFLRRRLIVVDLYASDELATKRIMERNEKDRLAGKPVRTDTDTPEKIATKLGFYYRDVVPAIQRIGEHSQTEAIAFRVVVEEHMSPDDVLAEVIGRMPVSSSVTS
jgi:adenylate kinase family enzyme